MTPDSKADAQCFGSSTATDVVVLRAGPRDCAEPPPEDAWLAASSCGCCSARASWDFQPEERRPPAVLPSDSGELALLPPAPRAASAAARPADAAPALWCEAVPLAPSRGPATGLQASLPPSAAFLTREGPLALLAPDATDGRRVRRLGVSSLFGVSTKMLVTWLQSESIVGGSQGASSSHSSHAGHLGCDATLFVERRCRSSRRELLDSTATSDNPSPTTQTTSDPAFTSATP